MVQSGWYRKGKGENKTKGMVGKKYNAGENATPVILDLFNIVTRDAGERGYDGGTAPLPFETGADLPCHKNIIANFTVYQHRLETNLLRKFAHAENSEWFSIINFCYYFWSQNCYWREIGDVFLLVSTAHNSSSTPLPYRCSGVPDRYLWEHDGIQSPLFRKEQLNSLQLINNKATQKLRRNLHSNVYNITNGKADTGFCYQAVKPNH